jgi:hypothetical protein
MMMFDTNNPNPRQLTVDQESTGKVLILVGPHTAWIRRAIARCDRILAKMTPHRRLEMFASEVTGERAVVRHRNGRMYGENLAGHIFLAAYHVAFHTARLLCGVLNFRWSMHLRLAQTNEVKRSLSRLEYHRELMGKP